MKRLADLIRSGCLLTAADGYLAVLADAAERSVRYPNFKSEISSRRDQRDKLSAYHRIWEIMATYQDWNEPADSDTR